MSVQYPLPHPVDVPVTDLDDTDDDIIFSEQHNTNSNRTNDEDDEVADQDFLEILDYENKNNNNPSLFGKFTSFFKPTGSPGNSSQSSYQMLNSANERDDDSFEINDEEIERPHGFDIRDYQIKLLNKKVRKTAAFGTIITGLLISIIIFLVVRNNKTKSSVYIKYNRKILSNSTHDFHPTTIIVSLDGFHPHYITPNLTPSMHNMLVNDYAAPYMIPSFPSSTFPNHWSLVTGLYPSEHGIVGNTFYDPILKKQFINTNPKVGGLDPQFWQGGEPIWQTAEHQGLNSAVHMWPGSEVPTIGPTVDFDRYNGSEALSSKVDRVMGWLDRPFMTTRPELILTYVPTIDTFGHKFGIYGSNLTDALNYVDNFIDLLQKQITERNLDDIVNLIIVSDHGMAPTSNQRIIYLDDLIDLDKIEHIDGWPLFGLRPYEKYSIDEIYQEVLANYEKSESKDHFNIYKVEDIPPEWEFGGNLTDHRFNYRLAPIWLIPKVGYSVSTHKQMKENNNEYSPKGVHGYNNTEVLMRAIFLGTGPYFRQFENKKFEPFKNTEVYNILCDSLNLVPSPNNGSEISVLRNGLPEDWLDPLEYPDLPFKVDHIVQNATYDLLWKKRPQDSKPVTFSYSTNNQPLQSMISEESSLTSVASVSLPKPTDFETGDDHEDEDEDDHEDVDDDNEHEDPEDNDDEDDDENEGDKGSLLDQLIGGLEDIVNDVVDEAEDKITDVNNFLDHLFHGDGGNSKSKEENDKDDS
ncbi:putative nucleotide pyrophosphatase precursor [Scheffersomyces coipomensis]|uniref:putative nucleotide pyrophosphatase precursor n=1 Tax=Scheffersomyces coipomensis TaxID=1788519 RepID=UPI00315CEE77